MKQRSYRWLFVTLVFVGFFADQASKYAVFRWLGAKAVETGRDVATWELVPSYFNFTVRLDYRAEKCDCPLVKLNGPTPPMVNHGALFGIFGEHENRANQFFLGISVLAAIVIAWWAFRERTRHERLLLGSLGLILGGTLGNLYDRLVFGGVRDFLDFYVGDWHWPTFNVADCCLVCGAGLLLIQAVFVKPKEEDKSGADVAHELKDKGVI